MTNTSDNKCVENNYSFANRDGKTFLQCSEEEQIEIIKALAEERCEFYVNRIWVNRSCRHINIDNIYRTLKPIPSTHKIDWDQVPYQFKYFYVNHAGQGRVSVDIPVKMVRTDGPCLANPGSVKSRHVFAGENRKVMDGEYGFVRGTVESIDSLLVRPIGE